jgi:hypothetical protein
MVVPYLHGSHIPKKRSAGKAWLKKLIRKKWTRKPVTQKLRAICGNYGFDLRKLWADAI